jgi:hypothetical protein
MRQVGHTGAAQHNGFGPVVAQRQGDFVPDFVERLGLGVF